MKAGGQLSILYFHEGQDPQALASLIEKLVNIPFPAKLIIASKYGFKDFHMSLSDAVLSDFNEFLLKKACSFEWVREQNYKDQLQRILSGLNTNFLLVLSNSANIDFSFFTDLSICMNQMKKENVDGVLFKSSTLFGDLASSKRNAKLSFGNSDQTFLVSSAFFGKLKQDLQEGKKEASYYFTSKHISSLSTKASSWKKVFPGIDEKRLKDFEKWIKTKHQTSNQAPKSALGKRTAIVVFVKTPGYSALKTRLGKGIGKLRAENFHLLSVKLIEKTLMEAKKKLGLQAFWAVSENEALSEDIWSQFPRLLQVNGGLGIKLHSIYEQLIMDFDEVLFIGADCPQISVDDLQSCISCLQKSTDFYIGPSEDGGYYLFGGKLPIHKKIWLEVPYSVENTLQVFQEKLSGIGSVRIADQVYKDVDTQEEYDDVGDFMFGGKYPDLAN